MQPAAKLHGKDGKTKVRAMNETEALIQRRELLLERVSKIDYEVERIDQRIAFLERSKDAGRFDIFETEKRWNVVST